MFRLVVFAFSVLSLVSVAKSNEIVLGAEDSWAPYSTSDGTGYSNTIITEAYALEDVSVVFRVDAYSRLLRDVEKGSLLALFNVTKEPSTENVYLFGEEKLFQARTYYYQSVLNPLRAKNLYGLQNGEKVGLIIGYEYGPTILENKNVTIYRVRSQDQLVRMIMRKRIDTAIMFESIANEVLPTIKGSHIVEKAFEGEHSNIYVAFSKQREESAKYAALLDRGLRKLKKSGRWDEILGDLAID